MHRKNEFFIERLPLVPDRPWIAYPTALIFALIAFVIRLAAEPVLPPGLPYVTFFPAVILASFLFGVGPGIVAGISGGYFAYYYFILPASGGHHNVGGIISLFFYACVIFVDILLVGWMQRANLKLAIERERNSQLAEIREMLFHEVQHRVSNNLQMAGALLNLQRRTIVDEKAIKALDEASRRLMLIGRISRNLYDRKSGTQGLEAFLHMLAKDILEASGRPDIQLDLHMTCDPQVPPDASVPMALVIAEAISNAIEHGFEQQSGAVIAITVAAVGDDGIRVDIADNGSGLPHGFSLDRSENLGLRIATMLARQLKGVFELFPRPGGGAIARLELPL